MRAFEIHTFTGGKWKIDSVFDDRELAVFEAQRIDESSRYAGVRVVEENFDEDTQKTTAKTIFRGGRVENDANRRHPLPPKKRAPGIAAQRGGAAGRARGAKHARKSEKSNTALVIMLAVILVGGLAALAALHFLPRFV
jgi:hypothetical protein